MSDFFNEKNSIELDRMFKVLSESQRSANAEHPAVSQSASQSASQYEFETRFGTYSTKRFVNGVSESTVNKLVGAQELFSKGPERLISIVMTATNSFGTPKKIIELDLKTKKVKKIYYQDKDNLNNIYSPNHNIKISLSRETTIMSKTSNEPKYDFFRLKDRSSYVSKNKLWQYDFTKVYELVNVKNPTILNPWMNNIFNGKEPITRLEFELEYLPDPSKNMTPKMIQQAYIDELVTINEKLGFSASMFSDKGKLDVFSQLKNLLPSRLRNKALNAITVKNSIAKSTGNLTYSNLALLLNGKYAVTEKIDGQRALIFLVDNKSYLIDLSNTVTDMGITVDKMYNNTLLDSEFVITPDDKCMLAVFDVLVDAGVNLTMDKTLQERLSRIPTKLFDSFKGVEILTPVGRKIVCKKMFAKQYYFPKNQHDLASIIKKINDTKFVYKLDGIIFTPTDDNYYTGTSLKWKPSQMNTIDFLVRITETDKKNRQIKINLYVGVSIRDFIAKRMRHNPDYYKLFPQFNEKSYYFPILFTPPDAKSDIYAETLEYDSVSDDGVYTVNGVPIKDNTVIEMSYQGDKWKPVKFRDDKTSVYLSQGRDAGNYWHIAYNVWENIMNPITLDVLTGKQEIGEKYFRKVETSANTLGMVKFHNFIKLCYYKKYARDALWIMELAGGRGNDINKHVRIGAKNVLLVDIDQKAIAEGQTRIDSLDPRERTTNFKSFVADISKDICSQIEAEGCRPGQFDTIVCNFAIHYVFGSKDVIQTVKDYVSKYLKHGGYFMFSTFDGQKVFDFLISNNVGYNEEFKFFSGEELLFVIKRLFKSNKFANYGQEIGIYIDRIGSYMNEYLVNLDYVINEFTKDDFKLIENTSFSKWHPIYSKRMKNKPKTKMSDAECQFSFLYNYIVMQKK